MVLLFLFVCFVSRTRERRTFVRFVIGIWEETKIERNYVLKMLFQMRGTVFSAGLVLILTWTIAVVPNSWQETMGIFVAMFVGLFFLLRLYVSKRLRNKQDNELNKFFLPTKCIVLYGVILLYFLGIVTISADGLQERFIQRQLSAWVFADWWWKEDSIISYRPARRFLNLAEQPIALKEIPPEIVGALIIKEAEPKVEEAKLKVEEAKLKVAEAELKVEEAKRKFEKANPKVEEDKLKREETKLKVAEAELKVEEAKLKGAEAKLKDEEAKFDPLCKYIGELDLSGRQLNYARFYGSQFRCVKLEFAELHGADLSGAELHGADLFRAKLHGADLGFAELHGANLSEAELHGADLWLVKLYGANLSEAGLRGANLFRAELHRTSLFEAELHGADLRWTELYGADLSGAELHGTDLRKAILKNTDLSGVRWDKPKDDWDNIISSIRVGLKKLGLADDQINKRVSRIEENSSAVSGFIPPNRPSENDCVFHSGQEPFKGWPEPVKGCDLKLASSLADLACQNQQIANNIVGRVIPKRTIYRNEAINLINALLKEDCSSLDPYREALSDELKVLNQ